jgi:hypothetical protein
MRLEIFILGITAFFVYNTYKDGKYTKMLYAFKKYYQMIFYVGVGLVLYVVLKKNPGQCKNLLLSANDAVKFIPLSKSSLDMLSPIFDFTGQAEEENMETTENTTPYNGRGRGPQKRSVSETKKKYVAANQDWKCGNCQQQLDHTFEIDHRVRLEYGGGNDVSNLVALCRNCHGKKTAQENM